VQSAHAAIDFQHEHSVEAREWQTKSNYLAFLTVSDEQELIKLITKAILFGIKHTVFREPDIGNEITAVAFEPSDAARKLTSSCSLLGKELCDA
jgi:peptidyl-tRNA hydrolase